MDPLRYADESCRELLDSLFADYSRMISKELRNDSISFERLSDAYSMLAGIRYVEKAYNDSLTLTLMSYICGINETETDFFPCSAAERLNRLAEVLHLPGEEVVEQFDDLSTYFPVIRFSPSKSKQDILRIYESKHIRITIRRIRKKRHNLQ